MIMVLAGTKDGRQVAAALEQAGYTVLATAVTPYGEELLKQSIKGEVLCGALDKEQMCRLIEKEGVKMLVDATHPFASEASSNALEACAKMKIPYLRYEREGARENYGKNVIPVQDLEGAISAVKKIPGNIFLTIGSSALPAFVRALGAKRIVARVLPTRKALMLCEKLNLTPAQIVALQGPFSQAFNKEMFLHYRAGAVVSKESGREGGLPEKIAAAAELDLPLVLIKRAPSLAGEEKVSSPEELLHRVKALWPRTAPQPGRPP